MYRKLSLKIEQRGITTMLQMKSYFTSFSFFYKCYIARSALFLLSIVMQYFYEAYSFTNEPAFAFREFNKPNPRGWGLKKTYKNAV